MVLLDAPPSRDYFIGILENAGIAPQIAHRSSHFEMVRGLVGRGLGYTLLATKPASPMTYDGQPLVSRRLVAEAGPSRIVLVRLENTTPSRMAEQFQQFCQEIFDQHP